MSGKRPSAFLVAAVSTAALFVLAGPASSAGTASAPLVAEPINAIILADESGSLTSLGVASERDAANALVTSDLSPNSRFAIAGFGSDNGLPGQNAVTGYCSFIQVSSAKARDALARCADKIHARTEAEGNDTDQATAIQYAIEQLKSQPKAGASVIFLLTDGVLDVHRSPSFGATPARRNAEALRRLNQQFLPEARAAGIQIWPLGFGPDVSKSGLERFAAGGAGANVLCAGSSGAMPHAIVAASTGDVIHSLELALARSRCAEVGPAQTTQLPNGGSKSLTIQIPLIATDGSLIVTKGEPSFTVSFADPSGQTVPSSGQFDGQMFSLSGQDSRVEALRIVNPIPGAWKITVSDPQHVSRNQTVSAFATWQGSLQASLLLTPALPKPGDKVNVELRVLSRNGIVPEKALRDANAEASATVATATGTTPVKLTDDGTGVFRGAFILPSDAKGDVTVKARVSGYGLAADQRVVTFSVQKDNFISASFAMQSPAQVAPRGTINGTVSVINQGPQRTGRLQLTGLTGKTLLTVSSPIGAVKLPNGSSSIPFVLTVPSDSPEGALDGQLQLVAGGQVIGQAFMATTVAKPKSFLQKNSWVIPLAIAVIVIALLLAGWRLLMARRSNQANIDTSGLVATLSKNGRELSDISWGQLGGSDDPEQFVFSVVQGEDTAKLAGVGDGGEQVNVRRAGQTLKFQIDGVEHPGTLGEPIEIGNGVQLVVKDGRQQWSSADPDEPSQERAVQVSGVAESYDDEPSSNSKYGN